MKVLHVSHTATISGGEHSLLTLLRAMPAEVELGVAGPDGALAVAVRDLGLPYHRIPGNSASFRLHPVRTPRAGAEMVAAAIAVRRLADRRGATVLHANSVRAGLTAALASTFSGPPVVVHVRDVLPDNAAARAIKRALTRRSALIAISRYAREQFADNADTDTMIVIDNPVDQTRFRPEVHDPQTCRDLLGLEAGPPLIGIVGQITPWKGHDTALRALHRVHIRHPTAKLLIVGEVKFVGRGTSFDNSGFLNRLHELVGELGLWENVTFLGERADIPAVLRALDVLLVPSTAEPFGRTVAEAMTMGTPVIATAVGGPAELLEHGVTGLLAAPGDNDAWASAIDALLSDPRRARQMADAARSAAALRFGTDRHVRAVLAVLKSATMTSR